MIIKMNNNITEEINIIKLKDCKTVNPIISIIIRTKNEEKKIKECLKSIMNQKIDLLYEIIIIDSESNDNTLSYANEYDITIYTIKDSEFNFGTSIQIGINLARGKYCVFLSAHAIPSNDKWLENLINRFDEKTAAIYSQQIFKKDAFIIEQRSLKETFGEQDRVQIWNNEKKYLRYKSAITFSNASSCIKKEIAMKIPFSRLEASEDREWAARVLKAGYNIKYSSNSKVYHYHNEDIKNYYRRIYINSKSIYNIWGVKINCFEAIYILLFNIIKDVKYILQNKMKFWKNIKISIIYRLAYVKAHYKATRE